MLIQASSSEVHSQPILDDNATDSSPRMALYRNREPEKQAGPSAASEGLKYFLASVASTPAMLDEEENVDFLTQEIGKRIRSFMVQSDDVVDVKMTLSEMGVDVQVHSVIVLCAGER
jgi:hypothetical protein